MPGPLKADRAAHLRQLHVRLRLQPGEHLYTEAKVDVTQEIGGRNRLPKLVQTIAPLCSISCVTSTLALVY